MIKEYNLLFIGGGAASLFGAALFLSKWLDSNPKQQPPKVAILEKMERCGRKVGITGKGRCNLTNTKEWSQFSTHIHPNSNFFRGAFYSMNNIKTIEFFNRIGLETVVERGDRVYPKSMKALSVVGALERAILDRGGEIVTRCNVIEIDRDGNHFIVKDSNNNLYKTEYLLIATGGYSYPSTGSTGDGYLFASKFGHKIERCFPSLTALIPSDYNSSFYGISLKNVSLSLVINGSVIQEEFGDLDFTNGGIEGPIGFKISRNGVYNLINRQKVEILLDLKPAVSLEQLKNRIDREFSNIESRDFNLLLRKLMPAQLISPFLKQNKTLNIDSLPYMLKNWRFNIKDFVGYERAVVTAGGVSLKEVNKKSMESKLVSNLFFIGELLDLDADTGGFNLQIAFSTAALAVDYIFRQISLK